MDEATPEQIGIAFQIYRQGLEAVKAGKAPRATPKSVESILLSIKGLSEQARVLGDLKIAQQGVVLYNQYAQDQLPDIEIPAASRRGLEVYLMRHALGTDTDISVAGLFDLFISIDSLKREIGGRRMEVYSSPAPPAVYTAKIVAREINGDFRYSSYPHLAENTNDVPGLVTLLRGMVPSPILFVTHEPCLKKTASIYGFSGDFWHAMYYKILAGEES